MKNLKITRREINLFLLLFVLLLLGTTYQFVYKKNMEKIEKIEISNEELEAKLDDLESKQVNKEYMEQENERLSTLIQNQIEEYGNGFSEEKTILFIKSLEETANMEVSAIIFGDPEYFLNATNIQTSNNAESSLETLYEDYNNTSTQESYQLEGRGSTPNVDMNKVSGYKSYVTISFRVSYDGLKAGIDYVNSYPEKRNIAELTVSYDTETGNLNGSMTIEMYNLVGTGRAYTEPNIGNVPIGNDTIFGTIDLTP